MRPTDDGPAAERCGALEIVWRYPIGKRPVRQLAILETFVAYVVSGSFDVMLVQKPTLGPR